MLEDLDDNTVDIALAVLLKSLPAGVAHLAESAMNQKNTKSKNAKHKDNVIDFSAYQKKR